MNIEKILVTTSLFLLQICGCATRGALKICDFKIAKNIIYKTVEGENLSGDLYQPNLPGKKPVVIVIHGGGWNNRAGTMSQISEDLARSGFVVFNITYRLAPKSLYPKAFEDVRDAVHFIESQADQYEIDQTKMATWGYSAGAELALLTGLDPKSKIQSIVAGGTPADFSAWPHSPIITRFIGKTFQEAPEVWREASPVNHVKPNSPPVFMYHGEKDDLVEIEQMDRMRAALEKQNVPVETHRVAHLGHIPVYLFSQESINLGIDFLKRRLKYRP